MSERILVIAPHADDETLGCGATLARHAARGDDVAWLLVTEPLADSGSANARDHQVEAVSRVLRFSRVDRLGFATTRLDTVPLADVVAAIGAVVADFLPQIVYLPFPGDAHSDHQVVFRAGAGTSKWFRYASVRSVRCYETLSETNFGLDPTANVFRPNYYVDVSQYLDAKLEAMACYATETGAHPFPRSTTSIESLARLRGAEAGVEAAEAFMLLKEIDR